MAAYLFRRLVQSALILLGVSFITFFLLYVLPADPVRQIAGRAATAETVENIRMCLGLISAREAELADALGLSRNERPTYADEPPATHAVHFMAPEKKLN